MSALPGSKNTFVYYFVCGGDIVNYRSDAVRHDLLASDLASRQSSQPSRPVFIFVGSGLVFSDRLVDLVSSEFSDTDIVHLTELAELHHLDPLIRSSVALVIIDETSALDLSEVYSATALFSGSVGAVLAYRTVEQARKLLLISRDSQNQTPLRLLPMNLAIDAWLVALRLLVLGENFIPTEIIDLGTLQERKQPCQNKLGAAPLPQAMQHNKPRPFPEMDKLTSREQQIIELLSRGDRNRTIARELGLSVHTVKLHVHNIFGKLGVDNRTSATSKFLSHQASK